MPYSTDWPLMSEVLGRLVEAGGLVDQVKADICGVIADRKVELRAVSEIGLDTLSWFGDEVEVPPNLKPDDIDWESSRARLPWRVGVEMSFGVWPRTTQYTEVELSILRTDVARVLVPIMVADRGQRTKLALAMAADSETAEALAAQHVCNLLKLDPFMVKQDVEENLSRAGYEISARGFEHRVWLRGRELAGLPRKATAGRPRSDWISLSS